MYRQAHTSLYVHEGQMYRQAHTLLYVQLADLQLDPSSSYSSYLYT
jgi:hypothetical protein